MANLFLTPAQKLEAENIARRRKANTAMIAQALMPIAPKPPGQRVHALELIAPSVQAYFGERDRKALDVEEKSLTERNVAMVADALGQHERATTASPAGYRGEAGTDDEIYMPAFNPTQETNRTAAMQLAGNLGMTGELAKATLEDSFRKQKLERVDLGSHIGLMDERGNIVSKLAKGVTPDAALRETGSDRRHETPGGGAVLGANVTMRGQDLTDSRTRSEGAANRGVSLRGQNMTDARSRDALDQGRVTDTQRVTASFADRMLRAEDVIGTLSTSGKPGALESMAASLPFVGKAAANAARDPTRQQYYQAQEDWVRAKLRKESGAVIGDEEMDREIRTYFPQIGDAPGVISQKAGARRLAASGMSNASGNAQRAYDGQERRQAPSGFRVLGVERSDW